MLESARWTSGPFLWDEPAHPIRLNSQQIWELRYAALLMITTPPDEQTKYESNYNNTDCGIRESI